MYYVLYNPKAGGNTGKEKAQRLNEILKGQKLQYKSVLDKIDYRELFNNLKAEDSIVLVGGDGTLCHFANDIQGIDIKNDIFYLAGGTGNDFLNDLQLSPEGGPYKINKYLENLPHVIINGKKTYFVNDIGFGIDGYCCEVADQMHQDSDKEINYTAIAIKGLLGKFKPKNAKVTIDGKSYNFKNVWLAPTMNGRFYGGGMMVAPGQDRLNKDRKVTLVVMHRKSKLLTLIMFPTIFKGEHVKYTKYVHIFEGYHTKVEFDKPCALQIDGETVLNVTSYEVKSSKLDN